MSVANRKFTDMKQIEFQQSGSSRVEAMLTQPLLDKASTYMCEITDLQATVGEELAFPENQWLFSIIRKPNIQPGDDFAFYMRQDNLNKYVTQLSRGTSTTFTASEVFGVPEEYNGGMSIRWLGNQYFDNDELVPGAELKPFGAVIPSGEYTVYSRRYYSILDFVADLAMQVKQIDRVLEGALTEDAQGQPAPIPWEDTIEDAHHYISLTVDSGGHLIFNLKPYFLNNYFIVTSPLFQKVTGFSPFVGKYVFVAVGANPATLHHLEGITDYPLYIHEMEGGDLGTIGINLHDIDDINDEFGTLYEALYYATAIADPYSNTVRDIIPVQDGIDIRKKLVVEVSLPISHTLCWDGEKETTKHLLQEFILSAGTIQMKYTSGEDYRQNIVEVQQKQNQGQLVLLNGGSNLALKKLFEGQMQAFRIDLLLDYDRWDKGKLDFVRTTKQLDVGQGGFFYLKLLFTKETI